MQTLPMVLSDSFFKASCKLASLYGFSTGLVHVKTIAVFIMHQQTAETLLSNIRRGKLRSEIGLTFPQTSGKRLLHLIQKSDYPC